MIKTIALIVLIAIAIVDVVYGIKKYRSDLISKNRFYLLFGLDIALICATTLLIYLIQ